MGRKGIIAFIFIFLFVSNTCNASLVSRIRKLIGSEPNNAFPTSQVSPSGSPVNESKTNPINAGKSQEEKQKESRTGNQTDSNRTVPIDSEGSNKNDKGSKSSATPSPPAGEKTGGTAGKAKGKEANTTIPKLGNNGSCKGSLTSCRDQEMLACIESTKDGSKELFLVVENEGDMTLKVTLSLPNYLKNDTPAFEVPKHTTNRMDISSTVGKSTEITVNSGNLKCALHLVHPVSADNLIQQLSFYSKQVTPVYAVYASFLVALLLGGTWAFWKFKKRNQHDGIPYQELEMGLPESAASAAVNVDATEGWDHDWDDNDDDWDEDNAVKSPGGHQVSSNGLTSKKDGWEDDWED